jgi:hypothetical protein
MKIFEKDLKEFYETQYDGFSKNCFVGAPPNTVNLIPSFNAWLFHHSSEYKKQTGKKNVNKKSLFEFIVKNFFIIEYK